ncbi:UNVERIFIED_CONTAM: tRNA-dihydrouridine(20/20a) synthase [Sesamum angustifolium]|uniref:tRNA-dihydrouridine(20/20a) synthase n=1 Tax=Sesamum angustifolium TaxID=2727405 RepID=A0AAW2RHL8_9LAMI
MKSAGHTLFASLTPVRSVILKNHGRFSSNFIYRYPAKSRKLHHYHHKCQSHKESIMVATRIAPMMDYTDNHFRTLARLISKHAWLYTEMIAAETIVYQKGNLDRFLAFGPEQHPIVLQIGELLNQDICGTAVDVQVQKLLEKGALGCALCLIQSVKCRIGVDDHDSYNELCDFIYKVSSQSPTKHFVIHSRKALLNGISPKENRSIPPLKYEYYYALVRDFPDLQFTINGGINTIDEVNTAIREGAHGVMVGRAAYNNSWNLLGHVDSAIYGAPLSSLTRRQVLEKYQEYGDSVLGLYGPKPNVRDLIKPLLGFFHSEPGNGLWKRKADAALLHCTTIKSFFEETLVAIPDSVLDSPITSAPIGFTDVFADAKRLLPPPHTVREEELLYA